MTKKKPALLENLRLEYYVPIRGLEIPKEYQELFQRELCLYWEIEILRDKVVSFPRFRSEAVYPDCAFERGEMPLKEAIRKVSREKHVPLKKLTELYIQYKHIEASFFCPERLEVLKELQRT